MDIQGFVLRPGDRVRASGRVVSVGEAAAAWFEPSTFVAMPAPPGHEPVRPPGHIGVRVTGVDLGRLERRRAKDGFVEGRATLTGIWRDTHLEAAVQGPAARPDGQTRTWRRPPCPPPDTGWPHGDRGLVALSEQEQATLGITSMTIFHPSRTQAVLVVAAEQPQRARPALEARYGGRLCVVRSRWTRRQIEGVLKPMRTSMRPWLIYQIGVTEEDGQALLNADMVRVLPAFAQWATTVPDELLHITPWLVPLLHITGDRGGRGIPFRRVG